jgi:hypothetical protein
LNSTKEPKTVSEDTKTIKPLPTGEAGFLFAFPNKPPTLVSFF